MISTFSQCINHRTLQNSLTFFLYNRFRLAVAYRTFT